LAVSVTEVVAAPHSSRTKEPAGGGLTTFSRPPQSTHRGHTRSERLAEPAAAPTCRRPLLTRDQIHGGCNRSGSPRAKALKRSQAPAAASRWLHRNVPHSGRNIGRAISEGGVTRTGCRRLDEPPDCAE